MGYSKQVEKLAILLLELLSEALGLYSNYLKDTASAKGHALLCHYSPPCREPELTLATSKQADSCFVTMLLQDHIGRPQVLHEDRWIDAHPIPGALVVNIGDLLQVSFLSILALLMCYCYWQDIWSPSIFLTSQNTYISNGPTDFNPNNRLLIGEKYCWVFAACV